MRHLSGSRAGFPQASKRHRLRHLTRPRRSRTRPGTAPHARRQDRLGRRPGVGLRNPGGRGHRDRARRAPRPRANSAARQAAVRAGQLPYGNTATRVRRAPRWQRPRSVGRSRACELTPRRPSYGAGSVAVGKRPQRWARRRWSSRDIGSDAVRVCPPPSCTRRFPATSSSHSRCGRRPGLRPLRPGRNWSGRGSSRWAIPRTAPAGTRLAPVGEGKSRLTIRARVWYAPQWARLIVGPLIAVGDFLNASSMLRGIRRRPETTRRPRQMARARSGR
jgi:hypothetical protein